MSKVYSLDEYFDEKELRTLSGGKFNTFEEAYNYFAEGDDENITREYSSFLSTFLKDKKLNHLKRGDVICVWVDRYRNDTCVIVSKHDGSNPTEIVELSTYPDDYGTVPQSFPLGEFPLDYFYRSICHNRFIYLPIEKNTISSILFKKIDLHVTHSQFNSSKILSFGYARGKFLTNVKLSSGENLEITLIFEYEEKGIRDGDISFIPSTKEREVSKITKRDNIRTYIRGSRPEKKWKSDVSTMIKYFPVFKDYLSGVYISKIYNSKKVESMPITIPLEKVTLVKEIDEIISAISFVKNKFIITMLREIVLSNLLFKYKSLYKEKLPLPKRKY